jgi:drug/metabolite transporter (DMT)-like permease
MGALNNALPFSLIFWGQSQMDSGLAAILNGTTAVFGAVVAGILLKDEPLTRAKILGAMVGLLGVLVIMGPDLLKGFSIFNLAQLAILAGALSYSLASVWGRVALSGAAPEANAFGMLACSTILMVPVVLWVDGPPRIDLPVLTWASILALAALSTASAYVLYFNILKRAGAANLMLVTLLVPGVAVALGAAFLGERLSVQAFTGFGLIALGLMITDGRVFGALRRSLA